MTNCWPTASERSSIRRKASVREERGVRGAAFRTPQLFPSKTGNDHVALVRSVIAPSAAVLPAGGGHRERVHRSVGTIGTIVTKAVTQAVTQALGRRCRSEIGFTRAKVPVTVVSGSGPMP